MRIFGYDISRVKAEASDEGSGEIPIGEMTSARWSEMFGGDDRQAERMAAVWACVNVIASTIASMPLQLFQAKDGKRARVTQHPMADFLDWRPNGAMTWTEMREAILYRLILRGDAYAWNGWNGGYLNEICPVPSANVVPKLTDQRRLIYEVSTNTVKVPAGVYGSPDLAHFKGLTGDGLKGISVIEHCRLAFESGVALNEYGLRSARSGAPLKGIVTNAPVFNNEDKAKQARRRWKEAADEAATQGGVAIFEGDLKFQQVSMSMRDAEFIGQMKFSVVEIARIFNVPPHKIQDLERSTFNNIEHLSREFYTSSLMPWVVRMEQVMKLNWLTKYERQAGLYFRHNPDALLRGDLASRSTAYQQQVTNGILTPNEVRALEDREPMAGGDDLMFPVNHQKLSQIGVAPADGGNQNQKV